MLAISIFTPRRGTMLCSLALLTILAALSFAPRTVEVASLDHERQQTPQAVFTNSGPITINDASIASPYPSNIVVSGIAGSIPNTPGSVKVTLCNFSHSFPDDVGIVLAGPTNAALLIQNGAGDDPDMVNVTYTLSDTGATILPDLTAWITNTYKPTTYYINDSFPFSGPGLAYGSPGPAGGGTATFNSVFGGTNPNGIWKLYVVDFESMDMGMIGCGWSLEINAAPVVTPPREMDFDGDNRSDVAVVRNTGGGPGGQVTWFIQNSSATPLFTFLPWGIGTDHVAPKDYDGDRKTDIAVWRGGAPFSSYFFILQSLNNTLRTDQFGQLGDDWTVVGDYDGDGRSDPATYRAGLNPGNPSFFYYRSSVNGLIVFTQWGQNGDIAIPGDFDGDRRSDFVVQRNAGGGQAAFYFNNTVSGQSSLLYGMPTDLVAPGDYDGDGKTDIAVVRGASGVFQWYIHRSSDGGTSSYSFGLAAIDLAVQADYDGDGKTDVAVWRRGLDPSTSGYYWLRSSDGTVGAHQWGQNGDYPVANYNAH